MTRSPFALALILLALAPAAAPAWQAPVTQPYASEHLTSLWGPILNAAGVDLVISGHLHSLFRFDPAQGKNVFPVQGGPTDGVIKASVTAAGIFLQVIDVNGVIKDELNLSAKPTAAK